MSNFSLRVKLWILKKVKNKDTGSFGSQSVIKIGMMSFLPYCDGEKSFIFRCNEWTAHIKLCQKEK